MLGKEAICDYPVRMRFVHSQPPGFQYCQKSSHHFDVRRPRHALAEQRGSFVRVRRRSIMKPSKPTGDQKERGVWGNDRNNQFEPGFCLGEVTPQEEICNGADDDCDGIVDYGEEIRVRSTFC